MRPARQPAQALGLKILSYVDELPDAKPGKHSPLGDELAALAATIDIGQWACIHRSTPDEAKAFIAQFSGGLKGTYQLKIRQHEVWMTNPDTPKKLRVTVDKTPGAPKPLPPVSNEAKTGEPVTKASVLSQIERAEAETLWCDLNAKQRQVLFIRAYRAVGPTSAAIAKELGIADSVAVAWTKQLRTQGLIG